MTRASTSIFSLQFVRFQRSNSRMVWSPYLPDYSSHSLTRERLPQKGNTNGVTTVPEDVTNNQEISAYLYADISIKKPYFLFCTPCIKTLHIFSSFPDHQEWGKLLSGNHFIRNILPLSKKLLLLLPESNVNEK